MKLLLIYAELAESHVFAERKKVFWEPLGIAYLAGYLRANGHTVDMVYPAFLSWNETDLQLYLNQHAGEYGLIGLSSASFQPESVKKFVDLIRLSSYEKPIILGGLGPVCKWTEFLDTGVDVVVLGEGEKTLLKIVESLEQGKDIYAVSGLAFINSEGLKVRNGSVELIDDLNTNVFPARDYAAMLLQTIPAKHLPIQIQTSRGCPGECSFCTMAVFQKVQGGARYRSRSAADIMDEIEQLYRTYGFCRFDFMDENFFPCNKEQALEKALELKREKEKRKLPVQFFLQCQMKAASTELFEVLKSISCTNIFIGVDSFSDRELKLFHKPYMRRDVMEFMRAVEASEYSFAIDTDYRIKVGFINFTPIVTLEELRDAGELFHKSGISCKKLMTVLRINDSEALIRNIRDIYPEFSSEHYFMHPKTQMFYKVLSVFYGDYLELRNRARHMEILLAQKKEPLCMDEAVKRWRTWLDTQFYRYYFETLSVVEVDGDRLMEAGIMDMMEPFLKSFREESGKLDTYLKSLEQKYDYIAAVCL